MPEKPEDFEKRLRAARKAHEAQAPPHLNGHNVYHDNDDDAETKPSLLALPSAKTIKLALLTTSALVADVALVGVHVFALNQKLSGGNLYPPTLCDNAEWVCLTPVGDVSLVGISAFIISVMAVFVPMLTGYWLWRNAGWMDLPNLFTEQNTKWLATGAAALCAVVLCADVLAWYEISRNFQYHPTQRPDGTPPFESGIYTTLLVVAQLLAAVASSYLYSTAANMMESPK